MHKYIDDNRNIFTNAKNQEYSKSFDEHCDKIIECCKNALIRFKQSIKQDYPDILLTFNIREYLDEEEKIEIFEKVNSENSLKEYSEHIKEFV